MASELLIPTRRGFLGIFAAATAAATATAAVAIPALAPAPMDWRAKPVEQWTQADFVAEAQFELAAHQKKTRQVFRVGMTHHEHQLYSAHQQMMRWWEIELKQRQGLYA